MATIRIWTFLSMFSLFMVACIFVVGHYRSAYKVQLVSKQTHGTHLSIKKFARTQELPTIQITTTAERQDPVPKRTVVIQNTPTAPRRAATVVPRVTFPPRPGRPIVQSVVEPPVVPGALPPAPTARALPPPAPLKGQFTYPALGEDPTSDISQWEDLFEKINSELTTDTMELTNLENQVLINTANSMYLQDK
eukprot:CAMPEP_0113685724 /NCGR_PEP_ID=MMETSP0038_2-20120614/14849_1 /TAXON_ID=2898 /ORGANISM="Cryptomonas paramecium" /LENGTH=192 /DNA_ID=CAMNT_0000605879 /DNA_START=25 /DNA_END=603 /DNA_ORIENTATION=+ /assembly_acc=CAM_ASM_000170